MRKHVRPKQLENIPEIKETKYEEDFYLFVDLRSSLLTPGDTDASIVSLLHTRSIGSIGADDGLRSD